MSTLEKIELYMCCANALNASNYSNSAFQVYYEAFRLVGVLDKKTQEKTSFDKEAEQLMVNAIKSPRVIDFQQIVKLESVKGL